MSMYNHHDDDRHPCCKYTRGVKSFGQIYKCNGCQLILQQLIVDLINGCHANKDVKGHGYAPSYDNCCVDFS